ncbi:hypothetical protein [Buchnera aphidicola]|uniref:hypothetical protein n=1 Tax=Buchnera aphidicola TaxID=9 RepID=UPI003463D95A
MKLKNFRTVLIKTKKSKERSKIVYANLLFSFQINPIKLSLVSSRKTLSIIITRVIIQTTFQVVNLFLEYSSLI